MNVDQLRSFLEIAETANFHRAAQRLGTTQSTISARIKMLEEQVGRQLFHRAKNGVHLTESGHRFYRYAQIAVGAVERGRAEVKLPKGVSHVISVGLQSYLAPEFGPHLVREVGRLLDGVGIRIEPDYSEAVIQQVSSGLVEIGVVYVPRLVSELDVERVGSQQILLVATPDVSFGTDEFFGGYIQVNWGQEFLQVQAEALGADSTPSVQLGSPRMALDLLLQCGGAAYLDRRMVADALQQGRLIGVEAPPFVRPVYAVWQPRRTTADLSTVVDIVKHWFVEQSATQAPPTRLPL